MWRIYLLQVVLEEGLRMLYLRSRVTNLNFLHECMEMHREWWDSSVEEEAQEGPVEEKKARREQWCWCLSVLLDPSSKWSYCGCFTDTPSCSSSSGREAEGSQSSLMWAQVRLLRKKENFLSSAPQQIGLGGKSSGNPFVAPRLPQSIDFLQISPKAYQVLVLPGALSLDWTHQESCYDCPWKTWELSPSFCWPLLFSLNV